MQEFIIERPGGEPVARRAHVGVVGSGNLEILCDPPTAPRARVRVRTTVDGFENIWILTIQRFLKQQNIAADIEINDFGATPATVTLRLQQALEIAA